MTGDPWLEPWLPALRSAAARGTTLELGCGTGRDTKALVAAGCRVTAVDRSGASIALAKLAAPRARFHRQDVREPFPESSSGYAAVVASLVLHYFSWQETVELVERIRAALLPGGLLLCRLNSTHDVHFGAQGHAEIEENYYLVDGEPKRFFSEATTRALFANGWSVEHMAEKVVDRYVHPKWLWEVVANRAP
ncbi:MAG: class I SAM-dependent methyltransferase [Burkholderiales bacterium]|nr:class I SAM-dependent methyltransferase [Burkholderiales bacterium]